MSDDKGTGVDFEQAAGAIVRVGEMVGQFRAGLVKGGFPEEKADELAEDLYRRLIEQAFPPKPAPVPAGLVERLAEVGRQAGEREADDRGAE